MHRWKLTQVSDGNIKGFTEQFIGLFGIYLTGVNLGKTRFNVNQMFSVFGFASMKWYQNSIKKMPFDGLRIKVWCVLKFCHRTETESTWTADKLKAEGKNMLHVILQMFWVKKWSDIHFVVLLFDFSFPMFAIICNFFRMNSSSVEWSLV